MKRCICFLTQEKLDLDSPIMIFFPLGEGTLRDLKGRGCGFGDQQGLRFLAHVSVVGRQVIPASCVVTKWSDKVWRVCTTYICYQWYFRYRIAFVLVFTIPVSRSFVV